MKQKHLYLTGMSGAGKTSVLKHFSKQGAGVWYTGDLIPHGTKDKLLYGQAFDKPTEFIARAQEQAAQQNPTKELIVIDSIRSLDELRYVRAQEQTAGVIGVLCGYQERIRRIQQRDKNTPLQQIIKRDQRDLGKGTSYCVGKLLALSDYYIDMQQPPEQIQDRVNQLYKQVMHHE